MRRSKRIGKASKREGEAIYTETPKSGEHRDLVSGPAQALGLWALLWTGKDATGARF